MLHVTLANYGGYRLGDLMGEDAMVLGLAEAATVASDGGGEQ